MGLDMYMYRRKKTEPTDLEHLDEVMYWRKANQIHKLLEDKLGTIEDCEYYPVSKEILTQVRNICWDVLRLATDGHTVTDASYAAHRLPRTEGFFFGDQEYDSEYVRDLIMTMERVDWILESTNFDTDEILYHAWW